jgi:hypothetical protein
MKCCCCCLCRWGETMSLICDHQLHPQVICEYEEPRWNYIDRVKTKNSEKNQSQCHFVSRGLTRERIRTSAVTDRRLTAWAIALPGMECYIHAPICLLCSEFKHGSHLLSSFTALLYDTVKDNSDCEENYVKAKLSRYHHAGNKEGEQKYLLLTLDLDTRWCELSESRPGRTLP